VNHDVAPLGAFRGAPDAEAQRTEQDTTARVWDIRYLGASLAVLPGRMGAIRSLRFSSDGRFLAVAEPADFVHIYDVKSDYNVCQEVRKMQ
jgi:WD40 repeat protein